MPARPARCPIQKLTRRKYPREMAATAQAPCKKTLLLFSSSLADEEVRNRGACFLYKLLYF